MLLSSSAWGRVGAAEPVRSRVPSLVFLFPFVISSGHPPAADTGVFSCTHSLLFLAIPLLRAFLEEIISVQIELYAQRCFFYKMKNRRGPRCQLGNWQKLVHIHLQGNIPVLVEQDVSKANLAREVLIIKAKLKVFPGGSVAKNPLASVGDMVLNPDPGGSHMPRSD